MSIIKISENIPDLLISFFKSIQSEFRIKLIELLLNKPHSLSEIKKILNKPTGYLVKNLHLLELSGVVSNFISHTPNRRDFSFYEITTFGKVFYRNITDILASFENNIDRLHIYKTLANPFRFSMLLFLNEENKVSFSKLQRSSNKNSSTITNHLHKLEKISFIQNFYQKTDVSTDYSFYKITDFAQKIIESIIKAYNHLVTKSKKVTKNAEVIAHL